jgi:hypothetical protein
LHITFGQIVGFDALLQLAGGGLGDGALEALSEAPAAVLLLLSGLIGVAIAVRLARGSDRLLRGRIEFAPPSRAGLLVLILVSGVGGAAILAAADQRSPVLGYGFDRKPSGHLLRLVIRLATDVDRDGFGWLSRPSDAAPFDGALQPFALEIPANGIDENGLAGDLAADFRPQLPFPPPEHFGPRRPSLLIVLLESFRGDLLGRSLGDREVTPTLNALAREGASSQAAYAHSPMTAPSRAQLFQGRIVPVPGARTLIDDFHELGYRVGYFSGQNDLFGGSDALVGFERADEFYDARTDREQRTSRTSLPASLQVSSDTVLDRVRAYLDATANHEDPLFLYVNLVDNHYPYHHEGLARLFDIDPVGRAEIRPDNAQRVLETYLQACANVDLAIGDLVALWRERMGEAPLLITADHGQSFYEHGMLGHGQSIDEGQSRVPLVLQGIGGDWPEPLGLADVRGLLLTHLFEPSQPTRFVPAPERRVFQYTGRLDRPYLIGLRSQERAVSWEFQASAGRDGDDASVAIDDATALLPLLWSWEFWQARAPTDDAVR